MHSIRMLAVTAGAIVTLLVTGCNAPVKVTGGGRAIGTATYAPGTEAQEVIENVPATASGQAILTGPVYDGDYVIGYDGKGNLQFVDHATGMCFHARLTFGGADPSVVAFPEVMPPDYDGSRMAYAEGPVRDCASTDGLFDDGTVNVWIYDEDANGPDKGDTIVVDRFDAAEVQIYSYGGSMESGNYKVRALSTE